MVIYLLPPPLPIFTSLSILELPHEMNLQMLGGWKSTSASSKGPPRGSLEISDLLPGLLLSAPFFFNSRTRLNQLAPRGIIGSHTDHLMFTQILKMDVVPPKIPIQGM